MKKCYILGERFFVLSTLKYPDPHFVFFFPNTYSDVSVSYVTERREPFYQIFKNGFSEQTFFFPFLIDKKESFS
jgi:hypothetical protein